MDNWRILYFHGGILEATDELACADLVDAAKAASSSHPHLTAEIWRDDRKVAIVRPSWNHRESLVRQAEQRSDPSRPWVR
jgi:hypothetical protein